MNKDVIDLKITIQDDQRKRNSNSFLLDPNYENIKMEQDDPVIQKYLKEMLDEFKGVVDNIKITATMYIA